MARGPKRPPSQPDVPREPDALGTFGHPKISIPDGERAQMTPPDIEPTTLRWMACDTSDFPQRYGWLVSWAGMAQQPRAGRLFWQVLWRRSQAQSRGCDLGPFPEWKFKHPKPQTRRNPPKPTHSPCYSSAAALLLYHCYSCCSCRTCDT